MKKIFSVLVAFIAMTTVSAQTENKIEITAECGDNVEITATAKTGWHFAGWEDGVAANPRLVENVNMDSTFYAMWERNDYTVTIIIDTDKGPGAGGTTTINGVESTTGNFKFEAECNLAVVVDNCYEFKGWYDANGALVSEEINMPMFQVTGDVTYTAKFEKKIFKITVISRDDAQGTIGGAVKND